MVKTLVSCRFSQQNQSNDPGRGGGFRLHGPRLPGRGAARRPPGGVEGDDGRGAGLAPRAAGGAAAAAEAA